MFSPAALLIDGPGGGLSGEPKYFSVGVLAVGAMAVEFGFVEVRGVGSDGFEARDLRTWAANSARVAGIGPTPLGSCSGVATVVQRGS
jgi:hypothetical protein